MAGESRRIRAEFTIVEQEVGKQFADTAGIGSYPIDLHPTSAGYNYIDFPTPPFHLPLGALLPVRTKNLLPACKNIGTTHVTNGCYRLHPAEWNIGEAAGLLAVFAQRIKEPPRAVRANATRLAEFQNWIRDQGIETHWPKNSQAKNERKVE